MKQPNWGRSPWRISIEIAAAPLPEHCEVAVLGAGLTGLSTAYHLAGRGVSVAVFEAATVGAGSSGRTGAVVLEGTAAGDLPGVGDCIPALEELVRRESIPCRLDLPGCWELVHRLEPGEYRQLFRDGDESLCIRETVPGGTVDASALLSGLARAALHRGSSIHEHAPAQRLEPPGFLVVGERRIEAEHVVIALNAYAPLVLSITDSFSAAVALGVYTRPLPPEALQELGLASGVPFYTIDLPYLWGRPLPDGRIIFGGGLLFPPGEDVTEVDLEGPDATVAFERLEERIRGFHPSLAGVAIEARWGGPIAFRNRGLPILSAHPDLPRVIVTGAYAGHGVALGVRIGQLVAEAIADGKALPDWGKL